MDVASIAPCEAAVHTQHTNESPGAVAASAALLRSMKLRSSEIQAELDAKQLQHEQKLAETNQQLREDKQRKLQRLLSKLGRCPGSTQAESREKNSLDRFSLDHAPSVLSN